MRRSNLVKGIVKRAITWAMAVFLAFTPVVGNVGSMVVYAEEGDGAGEASQADSNEQSESDTSKQVDNAQSSNNSASTSTGEASTKVDAATGKLDTAGLEESADKSEGIKPELDIVQDKLDGTTETDSTTQGEVVVDGIDDKLDKIEKDIETAEEQEAIIEEAKADIEAAVESTAANAQTAAEAAEAAANATNTTDASNAVTVANQAALEAETTVQNATADLQAAQAASEAAVNAYNDALAQLEAAKGLSEEAQEAAAQAVTEAEALVNSTKSELDTKYAGYVKIINAATEVDDNYKDTLKSAIAIYKSQIPACAGETQTAYWNQTRILCEYLVKLDLAEKGIKVVSFGDENSATGGQWENWYHDITGGAYFEEGKPDVNNYLAVNYEDEDGNIVTKYYNYHRDSQSNEIIVVEKAYVPTEWADEYTAGDKVYNEEDSSILYKLNESEHSFDILYKGEILTEEQKQTLLADTSITSGTLANTIVDAQGNVYYVEETTETVAEPVTEFPKKEEGKADCLMDPATNDPIYASSRTEFTTQNGTHYAGNAQVYDIGASTQKHNAAKAEAYNNAIAIAEYYKTLGYNVTIANDVSTYHTGWSGTGYTHYYYNFTITKNVTQPVTNYYTTETTTYAQAVTKSEWQENAIDHDLSFRSDYNDEVNAAVSAYQNALQAAADAKAAVEKAAADVEQAKKDLEAIQTTEIAANITIAQNNLAAAESAYDQAVANRDNAQASADAALASYNALVERIAAEEEGGSTGGGGGTGSTATPVATMALTPEVLGANRELTTLGVEPVALAATPDASVLGADRNPQTGDNSNGWLWATGLAGSTLLMAGWSLVNMLKKRR